MSADAPKPILCSAPGCFELVSRSFAYGSGGYCRQHAPPLQAQAGGPAVGGAQDRPAWETDDERRESCDDPDSDSEDEEEPEPAPPAASAVPEPEPEPEPVAAAPVKKVVKKVVKKAA